MTEDIKIINSPKDFVQTINSLLNNEKVLEQGVLVRWYMKAKNWYDPNVCSCRKKGLNESLIADGYKLLTTMELSEKEKIQRWSDTKFALYLNGEFVGNLP